MEICELALFVTLWRAGRLFFAAHIYCIPPAQDCLLPVLAERTSCTDWCATLRPYPHTHRPTFCDLFADDRTAANLGSDQTAAAAPPSMKA